MWWDLPSIHSLLQDGTFCSSSSGADGACPTTPLPSKATIESLLLMFRNAEAACPFGAGTRSDALKHACAPSVTVLRPSSRQQVQRAEQAEGTATTCMQPQQQRQGAVKRPALSPDQAIRQGIKRAKRGKAAGAAPHAAAGSRVSAAGGCAACAALPASGLALAAAAPVNSPSGPWLPLIPPAAIGRPTAGAAPGTSRQAVVAGPGLVMAGQVTGGEARGKGSDGREAAAASEATAAAIQRQASSTALMGGSGSGVLRGLKQNQDGNDSGSEDLAGAQDEAQDEDVPELQQIVNVAVSVLGRPAAARPLDTARHPGMPPLRCQLLRPKQSQQPFSNKPAGLAMPVTSSIGHTAQPSHQAVPSPSPSAASPTRPQGPHPRPAAGSSTLPPASRPHQQLLGGQQSRRLRIWNKRSGRVDLDKMLPSAELEEASAKQQWQNLIMGDDDEDWGGQRAPGRVVAGAATAASAAPLAASLSTCAPLVASADSAIATTRAIPADSRLAQAGVMLPIDVVPTRPGGLPSGWPSSASAAPAVPSRSGLKAPAPTDAAMTSHVGHPATEPLLAPAVESAGSWQAAEATTGDEQQPILQPLSPAAPASAFAGPLTPGCDLAPVSSSASDIALWAKWAARAGSLVHRHGNAVEAAAAAERFAEPDVGSDAAASEVLLAVMDPSFRLVRPGSRRLTAPESSLNGKDAAVKPSQSYKDPVAPLFQPGSLKPVSSTGQPGPGPKPGLEQPKAAGQPQQQQLPLQDLQQQKGQCLQQLQLQEQQELQRLQHQEQVLLLQERRLDLGASCGSGEDSGSWSKADWGDADDDEEVEVPVLSPASAACAAAGGPSGTAVPAAGKGIPAAAAAVAQADRQARRQRVRKLDIREGVAGGGVRRLGCVGGFEVGLMAEIKEFEKGRKRRRKQHQAEGGLLGAEKVPAKKGRVGKASGAGDGPSGPAPRNEHYPVMERPLCRHWRFGRCNKSAADCAFSHDFVPVTKRHVPCRQHRDHRCSKDDLACPFSHDPETIEPCQHLLMTGRCTVRSCSFSHAHLDSPISEQLREYYADRAARLARFRAAQQAGHVAPPARGRSVNKGRCS